MHACMHECVCVCIKKQKMQATNKGTKATYKGNTPEKEEIQQIILELNIHIDKTTNLATLHKK